MDWATVGRNDSRRWTGIALKNGTSTRLTATRGLDTDGRIWSQSYTAGGIMQQTFTYSYDRDTVTKTVREHGSGANEAAWPIARFEEID